MDEKKLKEVTHVPEPYKTGINVKPNISVIEGTKLDIVWIKVLPKVCSIDLGMNCMPNGQINERFIIFLTDTQKNLTFPQDAVNKRTGKGGSAERKQHDGISYGRFQKKSRNLSNPPPCSRFAQKRWARRARFRKFIA